MNTSRILLGCLGAFLVQILPAQTCVDFASLANGATYPVGATFSENTVNMSIHPGINVSGQPVAGGFAQVIQQPPGSGNKALLLNNSALCLELGCGENLTFTYTNSGGYVNLSINGDDLRVGTLNNGTFILGGTQVTVSGNTISVAVLTSGIGEICIGGQELIVDNFCFDPCDNPDCLEFEQISKQLTSGETFTEDGLTVEVTGFDGNPGTLTPVNENLAGHRGREIELADAGIALNDICASGIAFQFAQLRSGVEICVNGDCLTVDSMDDLDGLTLGGAVISVDAHTVGDVLTGTVSLSGTIDSFSVSGTSLRLDHVCREHCQRNCIDFEEEPVGTKYEADAIFTEDGYDFKIDKFQGGDPLATISDEGRAGHLGQDLHLEEAVIVGKFDCMEAFSVHYGQYAQGVTVSINGDSVTVNALESLDGQTLGGVLLTVTFDLVNGGKRGVLEGIGQFEELIIGGVNLYIDHLCLVPCPDPDCIDFEVFPLGAQYQESDILTEDATAMEVTSFGSGTTTATIADGNLAGHVGNEIRLQKAGLRLRYPCASKVTFRYAVETGPVQLSINGVPGIATANFSAYSGTQIGGVTISVSGTGAGLVTLTGTILEVVIAGADLRLDHICRVPCGGGDCLDFENIPLLGSWLAYQGFTEDNVLVRTFYLFEPNGNVVDIDPLMRTGTAQRAGHLGQDIRLTNATAWFEFESPCVTSLSLHFGNYGDLVNLQVNGQLVQAPDMAALDGMTVGGALVSVIRIPVPGGYTGILQLEGNFDTLYVGGADFFIDRVCFDPCEPIVLRDLRMINVEDISPTQRHYTMEVKMTGSGHLRLRANTHLGPTRPLQSAATITPASGEPDTYQIEITKPASDPRWFFWADAVYVE